MTWMRRKTGKAVDFCTYVKGPWNRNYPTWNGRNSEFCSRRKRCQAKHNAVLYLLGNQRKQKHASDWIPACKQFFVGWNPSTRMYFLFSFPASHLIPTLGSQTCRVIGKVSPSAFLNTAKLGPLQRRGADVAWRECCFISVFPLAGSLAITQKHAGVLNEQDVLRTTANWWQVSRS